MDNSLFNTFFIIIEQENQKDYLEIEAPNEREAIMVATHLTKFNWGTMTVFGDTSILYM